MSVFLDPHTAAVVGQFLAGVPVTLPAAPVFPPVQHTTAVIVFADIAGSTRLTEQLGDRDFHERARTLDAALRAIVTARRGEPIDGKLLGDGMLAVFTAATDALSAALECAAAGDAAGLPLHLGVHAGDVIREAGNVHGGAVNVAARISARAAPGEVLVSEVVRALARTSTTVTFEDRGHPRLKGVADAPQLFRVSG